MKTKRYRYQVYYMTSARYASWKEIGDPVISDKPSRAIQKIKRQYPDSFTDTQWEAKLIGRETSIPKDHPVQPIGPNDPAGDRATCGQCGLSWDDSIGTEWTPAPAGRCPFEYFHNP